MILLLISDFPMRFQFFTKKITRTLDFFKNIQKCILICFEVLTLWVAFLLLEGNHDFEYDFSQIWISNEVSVASTFAVFIRWPLSQSLETLLWDGLIGTYFSPIKQTSFGRVLNFTESKNAIKKICNSVHQYTNHSCQSISHATHHNSQLSAS